LLILSIWSRPSCRAGATSGIRARNAAREALRPRSPAARRRSSSCQVPQYCRSSRQLMNGSGEAWPRRRRPGRDFPILARDLIFAYFPQGGTEGSNPAHSTGESATNCTGGGLRWSPAAIHAHHYVPKDWMTKLKAETFAKCKMQAEFATEVRRRGRMDRRLRSSLPGG
jgi:hypothetical protein